MDKKTVLPGSFLSTEEEFTAGQNAFADGSGNVCAATVGAVSFNAKQHSVCVEKPGHAALPLEIGSIIYAKVMLVKESSVSLSLEFAEKNSKERTLCHGSASLMVSRVDTGFVKVLSEKFKIGDIVKARVDEIYPFGLELSTADPSLGVVKAFCAKCRQPLHLFGAMLKCLSCGATERRKISSDYVLK